MNDLTSNKTSKTTFADKVGEKIEASMKVDNKPANIQLKAEDSQAIANHLSQSIASLPLDDFMPDIQVNVQNETPTPCHPTEALPKVVETLPSQDHLSGVKWQQIKNLPGYVQSGIRKLGRDVFESFDCFQAFSEDQRAVGKDPHAEIMVMSDFTHGQTTVNHFAKMIVENGVHVENGHIDYGDLMPPNYRPEIIIMMTANYTFKLVRDRIENGAPVNLNSIYAWKGGLKVYNKSITDSLKVTALKYP